MLDEKLDLAVAEYRARREHSSRARGRFDNAGRFHTADVERCACCRAVRAPSRRWPWSELSHGSTAVHVAAVYGVDVKALRAASRKLDSLERKAALASALAA